MAIEKIDRDLLSRRGGFISSELKASLFETLKSNDAVKIPLDGRKWNNVVQSLFHVARTVNCKLRTARLRDDHYAWLEKMEVKKGEA